MCCTESSPVFLRSRLVGSLRVPILPALLVTHCRNLAKLEILTIRSGPNAAQKSYRPAWIFADHAGATKHVPSGYCRIGRLYVGGAKRICAAIEYEELIKYQGCCLFRLRLMATDTACRVMPNRLASSL